MTTTPSGKYTCNDYRQEMQLNGLRRRLAAPGLPDDERAELEAEIRRIESEMGLD